MAVLVTSLNTYGFSTLWVCQRTSPGVWSSPVAFYIGRAHNCTSGAVTLALGAAGRLGVVINNDIVNQPIFLGSGPPAAPQNVDVPLTDVYEPLGYWSVSHGAYFYSGRYHLILYTAQHLSAIGFVALSSATGAAGTWALEDTLQFADFSSVDVCMALRWDGVSPTLDVFSCADVALGFNYYGLYTYNMTTKQFSAAIAGSVIDFVDQIRLADDLNGQKNSNGIYRYPNGDVRIFYTSTPLTIYTRLFTGGAWNAPVAISAGSLGDPRRFAQIAIDPNGEDIHLFYYTAPDGPFTQTLVEYRIVHHDDTFTVVLGSFRAGDVDQSVVSADGSTLLIGSEKYDDTVDFSNRGHLFNAVWSAPITGGATTFTPELIPKDPSEGATDSSCSYLIFADLSPSPPATTLQLIKEVIGPDAASAWLLEALGPTMLSGNGPSVGPFVVTPGDYPLDETGPAGYRTSGYVCVGMTGPQVGQTVTIAPGDNVVCTIRNTKIIKSPPPQYHHRRNMGAG